MIALEYVFPGQITADDVKWLMIADNAGPAHNSVPLLQIEHALARKHMHLFRYRKGEGIVLVEVIKGGDGSNRLNIVRTAGVKAVWQFREVAELLQHTAREWRCNAIETNVYSQKLVTALRRIGAKAESVNMILEIPDGH